MKPLFALPLIVLAAACTVPDNPVGTSSSGVTQIAVNNGNNCFNNRCFDLNTDRGTVQMVGRNPARVPAGIDYSDGYVTQAEFTQMANAANSAYAQGIGRR